MLSNLSEMTLKINRYGHVSHIISYLCQTICLLLVKCWKMKWGWCWSVPVEILSELWQVFNYFDEAFKISDDFKLKNSSCQIIYQIDLSTFFLFELLYLLRLTLRCIVRNLFESGICNLDTKHLILSWSFQETFYI